VRYKKILVALDRSPQSDAVFEQALELAKKEEATLMLFHCLLFETPGIGTYADIYGKELINFSHEMSQLLKQESREARAWLMDYSQKAIEQGILAEWDLKVGDAGSQIRDLAMAWSADLVVVGRRGRRGLSEVLLGSISSYVVHHAPCSVLVIQGVSPKLEDTPAVNTARISSKPKMR
jgi:nucleotide-binding universal stress UspA family protein